MPASELGKATFLLSRALRLCLALAELAQALQSAEWGGWLGEQQPLLAHLLTELNTIPSSVSGSPGPSEHDRT